MAVKDDSGRALVAGGGAFVTTHWSVIVAASQPGNFAREEALAVLCRSYWPPVYAYVRGRGHRPADAEDLTQEFFARLLAKEWLVGIEPRVSRFRSFLLTAVSRFLANEHDWATAAKRGAGAPILALEQAEEWVEVEHSSPQPTAERAYDRNWALAVMAQSLNRLREEARANDKLPYFEQLSPFLSREPAAGEYETLANKLSLTSGAIGVGVLRLRRRYREVVRDAIADTVSRPEEVADELRYLVELLRQ